MLQAANGFAGKYGVKVASTDEIMKAKDVEAVLIGSSTGFHAEQIHAAASVGKAIIVRKVTVEVLSDKSYLADPELHF